MFRLSQNQKDSNSSSEQCAKCKRSFKTSRRLNQHILVCNEKQVIDPKVIETMSATVSHIKNVTVDEENIWNADSDVTNSATCIIRSFIGENHCFYYFPDLQAKVLLKKRQDIKIFGHSDQNKTSLQ